MKECADEVLHCTAMHELRGRGLVELLGPIICAHASASAVAVYTSSEHLYILKKNRILHTAVRSCPEASAWSK
jgi:hypothetical protein